MTKKTQEEVVNPFGKLGQAAWDRWKKWKKEMFSFTYKTATSEQTALNDLVALSQGNEDVAVEIINKSIANQWKGLHPLKINTYAKQPVDSATQRQSLNDALNKRFGNRGQA